MGGRQHKECRKCGVDKPIVDFELRHLDKSDRYYRLKVCKACAPEKYVIGHGPHFALNPCKYCGKRFKRLGPWCRVRNLVHCSDRCDRMSRRAPLRKCMRCERRLPFEAFERPPSSRTHRENSCKKCVALAFRDGNSRRTRTGPSAMLKSARHRARGSNATCTLRIADARKLYDGDCYMCGCAPHIVQRIDETQGFTPNNVRTFCTRCNVNVYKYGMGETLTWALETAARHFKEQLVLPDKRGAQPCEHCGELPKAEKARIAALQKQRAEIEAKPLENPAEHIVAALHEHVL